MAQNVRAFVAVEIDPAIREAAVELIDKLRDASADVKWVEPENLHLTVKFLGDVPLTETAAICQALQRAAGEVEPFELELGGAGAFPSNGRPRTIWLGAAGDERPMRALADAVEKRLQKLGFRREARRFEVHLTLGRIRKPGPGVKQLGEKLTELSDYPAGKMSVNEIVLFSSQLTADGPIYAPLGRARLRAKG